MSHTSTTISAPVSAVADVQAVLGLSSTSTTGKWSYLCGNTHGKINKWAKYKPIRMANVPTRSGTYWKGTNGDCGLNYPKQTKMSGIISLYNGGYNWDYNPPTGGSGNAYRIGDFDGYNHNALCFVQGLNYPLSYQKGSGTGITIDIQWRTGLPSNTLSVSDVGFGTWYFGVITVGNGVTRLILSSTAIGTNAMSSVLIPDSTLVKNNTYKIYPIVSAAYQASYGGSGITNESTTFTGLYTLPVSVGSVKVTEVVETSLNIKGGSVTVQYSTSKYTVGFTLQLILTTGFTMDSLKLKVEQCNERDGSYILVQQNITLSPSSMTGTGSTVKEQAYSGVQASSGSMLINMEFVKITVTGTNASRTYTATAIKQMRSGQDIPLIAEN